MNNNKIIIVLRVLDFVLVSVRGPKLGDEELWEFGDDVVRGVVWRCMDSGNWSWLVGHLGRDLCEVSHGNEAAPAHVNGKVTVNEEVSSQDWFGDFGYVEPLGKGALWTEEG